MSFAKEELLLKAILENIVDGIITIDEAGIVQTYNPAAERIFGYSPEETIGKNIRMLMPEPFRSEHDQYVDNYLKSGIAKIIGIGREVVGLRKDGSEFPLELAISVAWLEERRIFTGIVRDISERKQMEKQLQEERALSVAVLETVVDGIITIDEAGIVQTYNPAAENIFGYSPEETIGKNINMLMPEPYRSEHDQYVDNYLQSGIAKIIGIGREVVGLRKDGSEFPLELAISAAWLEDRRIFTGIVRDISERKKSEQEIIDSHKEAERANKAKSIFLANMSHEIRTPLNAILGFSQLLLRKKSLDQDTRNSIKTIDSSGNNLLILINEILDISKIEAGGLELSPNNFDLAEVVDSLRSMFDVRCREQRLLWDVQGFSKPTWVYGDEGKLRQILINLAGNAIKFTESGTVSLSVTILEKNQYQFKVMDTGPGISFENQKEVFEAFRQEESGEKKGGTGLGLAISDRLVKLMGSELKLESKLGRGSEFYFTVEFLEGVKGTSYARGITKKVLHLAPDIKVKALVVDDIKENRDVMTRLLLDIGVDTLEAKNGEEGVAKVRKHEPDIIFMDIRMPVMRGDEALKVIHKEFGKDQFKVVAVTASAFDRQREDFVRSGFDDYVTKPFREEDIFNCLKELLGVDFVFDEDLEAEEKAATNEKKDFSGISLQEENYRAIKEAAEHYSVTKLESYLQELHQLNSTYHPLVDHLEALVSQYKFDEVLEILESLSKTKE